MTVTTLAYPFIAKSRKPSQRFGKHPSWYNQFGMKGHNGIDFPVAFSDVVAADDGIVAWVKVDDDGFGLHTKIKHSHGHTLYAHLSFCDVKRGQKVRRGEIIGLSGNSGNSTGPHLHFGYIPNDANHNNGYYGYVDPEPMLVEDFNAGSMFGFYVLAGNDLGIVADDVARLHPRAIVINFAGSEYDNQIWAIKRMRKESPHTHIVGRMYKPDGEWSEKIASAPEAYARRILSEMRGLSWLPFVDSIMLHNEVLHDGNWYSATNQVPRIALKARFDIEIMSGIRGMLNIDAAQIRYHALVAARGTPDIDIHGKRWPTPFHEWELYLPALRKAVAENHFIDVHQYGINDPNEDTSWFAMRFEERVLPWLMSEHPDIYKTMVGKRSLFISEGVWDTGHKEGWMSDSGPANTDAAIGELREFAARLFPYYNDGITFGHVLFAYGSFGGWSMFDITRAKDSRRSLLQAMIEAKDYGLNSWDSEYVPPTSPPAPEPLPTPTPTPRGNMRNITNDLREAGVKVVPLHERADFDIDAMSDDTMCRVLVDVFSTRDGSWVDNGVKYGMRKEFTRYNTHASDCAFDDAGGTPDIFFMLMSKLPPTGDMIACEEIHHGESGFILTTESGLSVMKKAKPKSGWGSLFMDHGSTFYPDDGQHGTWTLTPFGYSDKVTGLGMINQWHISIFATFVLMTWKEYKDTFMVPKFESLREKVMYYCDKAQVISPNATAALQKKAAEKAKRCTGIFTPSSPEVEIHWKGTAYVCQKMDPLTVDDDGQLPNPRYYIAPMSNVNDVSYIEGKR